MSVSALALQNRILEGLSQADFARLRPHMVAEELLSRQSLEVAETPIINVFFPCGGIVVVAGTGRSRGVVTSFGRDGMTGTTLVLGGRTAHLDCFVQVQASAVRISAIELRAALDDSPTLLRQLLVYVRTFLLQTAATATANTSMTITERVARWVLMCRDRLESDDVPLTHESLSVILGTWRPGITRALQSLAAAGAIRIGRGKVEVLDGGKLQIAAGPECHCGQRDDWRSCEFRCSSVIP